MTGPVFPPGPADGGRMRVTMVSRLFPNAAAPTFGMFNRHLARALSSRCALQVVAPLPNATEPPTDADGVSVLHPSFVSVPLLNRALAGHSLARTLLRMRLRSDVVLATFAWPDGYAATRTNLPVVIKCGGSDIEMLPASGPRRRQTLLALRRARRIYVVAGHLRDLLVQAGVPAGKIAVVHNGVDHSVFHPRDRATTRHQLGIPERETLILYVGWIEPDKGVEHLLRAHASLRGRPCLALVGAPPRGGEGYRRRLEALARSLGTADRCRFVGSESRDRVASWMGAADAFAFPSLHEGCPNVVLEALASGLPLVATNVGGIPEITPNVPWAELVPPRDPAALAAALGRMLEGRWDRAAIAGASLRTWHDVADDVHRILVDATHCSESEVPG